jgi:prepilin-type N-terminal cleavage/methylation domain-containing protein
MRRRQGFTIVELLVALALIVFIMVILTEAFTAGLESFRRLKAIGDMQEKMRAVSLILRRDFQAEHFDEARGNRLSDQDMTKMDPPNYGYFRLTQQWNGTSYNFLDCCSVNEGTDADGLISTRQTTSMLQFTVRLRGVQPPTYFSALPPTPQNPTDATANGLLAQNAPADIQLTQPTAMFSQWAEVAYFLKPKQGITAGQTTLYALYRRQRLLAHTFAQAQRAQISAQSWPRYYEFSFPQPPAANSINPVQINTASTITLPYNRVLMDPNSAGGGVVSVTAPPPPATGVQTIEDLMGGVTQPQAGDDLLLTNVISFDVKAVYTVPPGAAGPGLQAADLPPPPVAGQPIQPYEGQNPAFTTTRVFDTWCKQGNYGTYWNDSNPNTPQQFWVYRMPLKIRILALQITIRIWDEHSEQARQISIIQEM